jgi:hypothetical protein
VRRFECALLVVAGCSGAAAAPAPPVPKAGAAFEPLLAVTDAAVLKGLEAAGLDAGTLAFGQPEARSLAQLGGAPGWASIVEVLRADIAELYKGDARYGVGMRHTHRGFDPAWLTSPAVHLELAAVVNRLDRKVFHPGTCGELRFVYRMAYDAAGKPPFSSRLPATINVVFFVPDDGQRCATRARGLARPEDVLKIRTPDAWQGDSSTGASPSREGRNPPRAPRLKSIEVNLQTSRWPSTIRPDLGGHADYLLRVFHPAGGGRLAPAAMENMPDVEAIRRDPARRRALEAWLRAPGVLDAVDRGTALVPETLLARRAVSVTPRGLARAANAPFRRLLADARLDDLDLLRTRHLRSREALLRRLDALTCVGCHQSRSLAGFHVVGAERDAARRVDALAVATSPHFDEDMPRRRAYLRALAAGHPPDETRLPAERESGSGTFGHACGLGDPGFADWTCAAGFDCVAVDDDRVGQCMPRTPRAGVACKPGAVAFASDRIKSTRTLACGGAGVCEDVRVGFPGGMCASSCGALAPGDTCGAIALLTPFNNCLARGGSFVDCAQLARPAGLAACDAQTPCRPDYLCARTPDGGAACLPPYFVLQMRVDGHRL